MPRSSPDLMKVSSDEEDLCADTSPSSSTIDDNSANASNYTGEPKNRRCHHSSQPTTQPNDIDGHSHVGNGFKAKEHQWKRRRINREASSSSASSSSEYRYKTAHGASRRFGGDMALSGEDSLIGDAAVLNIRPEPPPTAPVFDLMLQLPPPPPPPVLSHRWCGMMEPSTSALSLSPPPPPPDDGCSSPDFPQPIVLNRPNRVSNEAHWGVGTIRGYKIMNQVGEGTYGYVYKAMEVSSGRTVALKKVRLELEREGFPITAIREIKILRQLRHCNIVNLFDIVVDVSDRQHANEATSFFLVFEYVDHDLMGLLGGMLAQAIEPTVRIPGKRTCLESHLMVLTMPQMSSLMKQLLRALSFTHSHNFLHRDLKASNILINNRGELKLADYGLARLYNDKHRRLYTNHVITLWYRPPELLFGEERYGPAIDVWSAGCILAAQDDSELFTKKPIFQGTSDMDQLECIFRLCGSPTPVNWPDVEDLPQFELLRPKRAYPRVLNERFNFVPKEPLDLLDKMLTLCPEKRISAASALEHYWLRDVEPEAIPPPPLPRHQDCHEMWIKNLKRRMPQKEN